MQLDVENLLQVCYDWIWQYDDCVGIPLDSIIVHEAWVFWWKQCLSTFEFYVRILDWIRGGGFVVNINEIFRLPWNQTNLFGYVGETCFSIYSVESYYFTNGSILLLFISICLHHRGFLKVFHLLMNRINSCDDVETNKKRFADLIEFHVSAKEWDAIFFTILFGSMKYFASL